jgi:hypothetical protein
LLITEKLELPPADADFGPFEYEPIPFKSVDYLLDDPYAYYEAMTVNIAKLAAWGKQTPRVSDVFDPPGYPPAFFLGTRKRVEHYQWFLREVGSCLVPEALRTDDDSRSMLRWLPEVEMCQTELLDFLFADADYCGFTHQNMNTDNASFWRDEQGRVQSGFIDWGRFKRDNYARGLTNGYMCTDLCEFLQAEDEKLVRAFAAAYNGAGGSLDASRLWEQYLVAWLLLGLSIVDLPRQILFTSPHTTQEGWKRIKSYKDPCIFHMPNYTNGTVAMCRNFAYYWHTKDLGGLWQKWKVENLTPARQEEVARQSKKLDALAAKPAQPIS